jgi:hypothetical protein
MISSTTEGSFTEGKKAEHERGREGDRDDDQQVVEGGHRRDRWVEGIAG